MTKWFLSYLDFLLTAIPDIVYIGLLTIFCVVAAVLIAWKGAKSWRWLIGLLLIEYVFVLFCTTVLFRETKEEAAFNYELFWSYQEIAKGIRDDLLPQVIMNVAVFIPVGIMTGIVTQSLNLRRRWLTVIGLVMALSISIEVLQLLYGKGFAELDDVFHNSLGCVIGYVICRSVERWLRR